jgi:hypothetical protein
LVSQCLECPAGSYCPGALMAPFLVGLICFGGSKLTSFVWVHSWHSVFCHSFLLLFPGCVLDRRCTRPCAVPPGALLRGGDRCGNAVPWGYLWERLWFSFVLNLSCLPTWSLLPEREWKPNSLPRGDLPTLSRRRCLERLPGLPGWICLPGAGNDISNDPLLPWLLLPGGLQCSNAISLPIWHVEQLSQCDCSARLCPVPAHESVHNWNRRHRPAPFTLRTRCVRATRLLFPFLLIFFCCFFGCHSAVLGL